MSVRKLEVTSKPDFETLDDMLQSGEHLVVAWQQGQFSTAHEATVDTAARLDAVREWWNRNNFTYYVRD